MYVKRVDFPNAKYLVVLDRPGFGSNANVDTLVYSILAGLSSVVVHHVNGELSPEAIEKFAFLAKPTDQSDDAHPKYSFPQQPKLMWLMQNVTTSDLKDRVGGKKQTMQEVEQTYLRNAFSSLDPASSGAQFYELFYTVFPEQSCFPIPAANDKSVYNKRIDKLSRTLIESGRNRYIKGVLLNGPLFSSILVSMLAHRPNVFQAFKGKIWKDTIHNCCLNIVESAIKVYKARMAEQLGGIVDTTDMDGFVPAISSLQEPLPPVEKLFKDLVESMYLRIQEENNRISSDLCKSLLTEFHKEMSEQADRHLLIRPEDEDAYSFQITEFKRFFHHYQAHLYELIGSYTDRAQGPQKKEELTIFLQHTIRPELAELTEKLEKIRHHDIEQIEESIQESEKACEESAQNQRMFQTVRILPADLIYFEEAMNAQTDVNKRLVEVAKLQALRKESLEGAVQNVDIMHEMATTQKDLLEEAAFVSMQLPSERVIEATQETEVMELQGYLIKQGGGGNAFNPLGRHNWKQRYFILIGTSLAYAKTKDDYERGRIIKELDLAGCRIEPSKDAGEGFHIIPPEASKGSHVFNLQKGLFAKNRKKRSSHADSHRVFKLRAQTIEERDTWIDKLRQSSGVYY
ncbi:Interferon-induced guanylate-binding protein 1-like, partial [Globisporangium splendens]